MGLATRDCACGRRYQGFDESEEDSRGEFAWCRACADKVWHSEPYASDRLNEVPND